MTDGTGTSIRRLDGAPNLWRWYAAIAVLIFAVSVLGDELTRGTGRIPTIWISNGVLLCFVLRAIQAKRTLGEVLAILAAGYIGNVAADLVAGDPLTTALSISFANIVEAGVCAAILRSTGIPLDFTRPKLLMVFCLVALVPAPLVSGLLAAGYLVLIQGADAFDVLRVWYPADALGLIIVTPPLMVLRKEDLRDLLQTPQLIRLAGGAVIVGGTLLLVFGQNTYPLLFLVFPAILVATFWLGFTGASLAILMTAIIAGVATFNGYGPLQLIPGGGRSAIFVLQIFIAAAGLQNLTVAAVLSERKRLEEDLREAKFAADESKAKIAAANTKIELALADAETASEAKTEFLASMSHEMRTPLNAILGFTGIVLDDGGLAPQANRQISLAHKAAQSLLAVVNDILDFSKIEAGPAFHSAAPVRAGGHGRQRGIDYAVSRREQGPRVHRWRGQNSADLARR